MGKPVQIKAWSALYPQAGLARDLAEELERCRLAGLMRVLAQELGHSRLAGWARRPRLERESYLAAQHLLPGLLELHPLRWHLLAQSLRWAEKG